MLKMDTNLTCDDSMKIERTGLFENTRAVKMQPAMVINIDNNHKYQSMT